ncbi:MAG: hypothetical protein L0241_18710 [Planctomycetia bacterium]|nr:hypothetical protein [Planctomycetia bacterium]
MARVRLYLQPVTNNTIFRFIRPGGIREAIPALRLRAYAYLTPHVRPGDQAAKAAFPECIIDTGSHLTTIPEYIWGQFKPGAVTPLPFDPAMPQSQRVVALAGGTWDYDLGELTITLRDQAGRAMNLLVVAQLIRDSGRLNLPLVLGLRGGVLDGRILRAEPDATVPYGQVWLLEDP